MTDWLFAPTDNINLIIEVAVGITVTAWVAGVRSKQKIQEWLESPKSDPYIEKIVAKIPRAQMPDIPHVPTVQEIIAALPEPPDLSDKFALMEERMGAKLTASFEAKWSTLGPELSTRVGQVVQANIASAKAKFRAGLDNPDDEESLGIIGEIGGALGVDNETLQRFGKLKRLYNRGKQAGGGKFDLKSILHQENGGQQVQQPGQQQQPTYQMGQVVVNDLGTWVLTQKGWLQLDKAAPAIAPPPAAASVTVADPDLPPELPPEPTKK